MPVCADYGERAGEATGADRDSDHQWASAGAGEEGWSGGDRDAATSRLRAVEGCGPVYISFDMDVLDPAYAPGISHREPGGMSVREAIAHLHAVEGEIVGADVVEYNPVRDVSGMTAMVAAKLLKEILGKMIAR